MQTLLLLLTLFSVAVADHWKVVCYYASWSTHRNGAGKFVIEDINPNLCTHLIYAFIDVNPDATIKILDYKNDITNNGFRRFNDLKYKNPYLKTMVSIGGSASCSSTFSRIARSSHLRSAFVENIHYFLKQHNFDGLDLDWEYPGENGGIPEDKENFVTLIRELKARFAKRGFILSAAVGADLELTDTSYDVPQLSKYLDFINIAAYNYHGPWEKRTGIHNGLYRASHNPNSNAEDTINQWILRGACQSKLILGFAFFARTFKLSQQFSIGAPALGAGSPGPYTQEPGILSYNELCIIVKDVGFNLVWEEQTSTPYAYRQNQWMTYEDIRSAKQRVKFIKKRDLGGAMVWSIDQDDFRNACGKGSYTLLTTIYNTLFHISNH